MSVAHTAYAVIGVKIPRTKLYKTIKIRAFAHDWPEDYVYDPKTAVPLWRNEARPIEAYDEEGGHLAGYCVFVVLDDVYIALAVNGAGRGRAAYKTFLPTMAEEKQFHTILAETGLESDTYGLWAILEAT